MNRQLLAYWALCCLVSLFSCNNEPPKTTKPVVLESFKMQKREGADCDKPDSLRSNCVTISLAWPSVKEGSEPLKKSVSSWTNNFLAGMMLPSDSATATTTLDAAVHAFVQSHHDWKKDAPESMGSYYAESWDTVLCNDGKHLTLQLFGETYTGGAHGNHLAAVGTFDAQTGRQLTWADLVTDTAAVKALAEKTFREVRGDIFKPSEDGTPGFNFDDGFYFTLPQNYGLTDKGVYFYYMHYEVTPYALGSTGFLIPFEALGGLRKKI